MISAAHETRHPRESETTWVEPHMQAVMDRLSTFLGAGQLEVYFDAAEKAYELEVGTSALDYVRVVIPYDMREDTRIYAKGAPEFRVPGENYATSKPMLASHAAAIHQELTQPRMLRMIQDSFPFDLETLTFFLDMLSVEART